MVGSVFPGWGQHNNTVLSLAAITGALNFAQQPRSFETDAFCETPDIVQTFKVMLSAVVAEREKVRFLCILTVIQTYMCRKPWQVQAPVVSVTPGCSASKIQRRRGHHPVEWVHVIWIITPPCQLSGDPSKSRWKGEREGLTRWQHLFCFSCNYHYYNFASDQLEMW